MKNLRAALTASLFAAALAACSEGSIAPEIGTPTSPSRNGGLGYGSGNVVPTDTSTHTSAAGPAGTTATEPTDSAALERGGMGYGSGN